MLPETAAVGFQLASSPGLSRAIVVVAHSPRSCLSTPEVSQPDGSCLSFLLLGCPPLWTEVTCHNHGMCADFSWPKTNSHPAVLGRALRGGTKLGLPSSRAELGQCILASPRRGFTKAQRTREIRVLCLLAVFSMSSYLTWVILSFVSTPFYPSYCTCSRVLPFKTEFKTKTRSKFY